MKLQSYGGRELSGDHVVFWGRLMGIWVAEMELNGDFCRSAM